MIRLYPLFLSLLGILGLATTMVFLVGVVLSFLPGHQAIAHFFVGRSDLERSFTFLLVGVPYVLIIAHVYLRTHAGALFLRKGHIEEAIAYCEARLKVTLGRGHKEVAYHRLYLAKALIAKSKYKAALAFLDGVTRCPAVLAGDYALWELECALRHEDLVRANSVVERSVHSRNKRAKLDQNTTLCAAAAELALRQNQTDRAKELVEQARWTLGNPLLADVKHPRLAGTILLARARKVFDPVETQTALLEYAVSWTESIPGAMLEILLAAGFPPDDQRVQEAVLVADTRSKYLLQPIEKPNESRTRTDADHL